MGGVFLGMPGTWAGHMHEAADHYTTKIGGLPDWPIPLPSASVDLFKCSSCKSDLSLLAQVYAPISHKSLNIEERVIYVFGCLMPECGSTTVSWRAIRIQKSVNSEGLKSQSDKAVSSSASSVSDSKEEWKKDISSSSSLEEDDDEDDDDDDIDLAELGRALSEAASLASQSKKQNHGRKLTAKISSPVCADRVIDKKLPVIPCFYIYAEEEKFSKKDASVCSKNISSPIKDHESDPDSKEETWEVEDYEYDRALNADRIYLKFKKRVDAYPEQCFRYSYGGKPLLASGDAGDPGMCRLCGAARQYEMQLMPPLLYFLQEAVSEKENHALDNWNWMTLIVYTCSQNCSNDNSSDDGWTLAEEAVVVQYE
uniref:Programmed cell death protein 2 C-terminal domain-containing protein n=1 Tax=Solanum tuberosum TaxID=4113 RepID=M1D340_SOLTU